MLLFSGNLCSNGLNSLLRLRDFDFIIKAEPHGSTEENSSEEEVSTGGVWLAESPCLRGMEASWL